MSITVLSYHDQALIDQVNTAAALRAEALEAEKAAAREASNNFSSVLNDASDAYSNAQTADTLSKCPSDLYAIFEEAASTFGVSVNLLTSIARAESGFNANAVSSAGAIGIMQLMPSTAASLGVTNSYDVRENIMGGAKLISQLLSKYNGNTALALAAYNAGSSNVDNYGGIPPFTETQNYVRKVLSYLNTENGTDLKDTLSNFLSSGNVSDGTLDALVNLLKSIRNDSAGVADNKANTTETVKSSPAITVTIINESPTL